jgi:hypothetical protein
MRNATATQSERRTFQQLYDLACENLRRHFPHSAIVRQLDRKLKPAPVIAKAAAANVRCKIRACPWPAAADGFCRQHALDAAAERSTMPCGLGPFVTELHGRGFHPAPSR